MRWSAVHVYRKEKPARPVRGSIVQPGTHFMSQRKSSHPLVYPQSAVVDAVRLYHGAKMSLAETAERIGCTKPTVAALLRRAGHTTRTKKQAGQLTRSR